MKRKSGFIFILLILSFALFSGCVSDDAPNNNQNTTTTSTSSNQSTYQPPTTPTQTYSPNTNSSNVTDKGVLFFSQYALNYFLLISNELRENGYSVGSTSVITDKELLLGVRVLVIEDTYYSTGYKTKNYLTDYAINIILEYVYSGGNVLIMNDAASNRTYINEITTPANIFMNNDHVLDDYHNLYSNSNYLIIENFPSHPIFSGINKLLFYGANSFETSSNNILLYGYNTSYSSNGYYTASPPLVAIGTYGKGNILIVPARTIRDDEISRCNNDNVEFVLNCIKYLDEGPFSGYN